MFLVDRNRCIGCSKCARSCPQDAISMVPWEHRVLFNGKEIPAKQVANLSTDLCICCGECQSVCPTGAITRVPRRAVRSPGGRRGQGRGYGRRRFRR